MKKKKKPLAVFITRTSCTELLKKVSFKRRFDKVRRACDLIGHSGILAKKGQTDVVIWRNQHFKARWASRRQARAYMAKVAVEFGNEMVTILTRVKRS